MVTSVPGGVWVRALARRLPMACWSLWASPVTVTASSGRSRSQWWPGPAARASSAAFRISRVRSTGSCSRGGPASRRAGGGGRARGGGGGQGGEEEQVVDEAGHALRFAADAFQGVAYLGGDGAVVAQGEFGVAT